MEVWLHEFLTSVLDGGEWSASHPRLRAPGIYRIEGWVGSRTGLKNGFRVSGCNGYKWQ